MIAKESRTLTRLRLSNSGVTVTAIPELGGKISSILWQNHEILFQNPIRGLRPADYAASYSDFDASGFDECLPSIGACPYPTKPWRELLVPDHGELWSIPWSARQGADSLALSVVGVQFPYSLQKVVSLPSPGAVSIHYQLTNKSPYPFPYIWSAHPLLAIEPGSQIHLPDPESVVVDWSRDERLGEPFTRHPWPATTDRTGKGVSLDTIADPAVQHVEKLYTSRLTEGWCGVHHPSEGRWVGMVFPVDLIPFVGLSINQGGWPVEGPGYFNLGLEPCNGYPDRLDLAVSKGCHATLPAGETTRWRLDLRFGQDTVFPANQLRELSQQLVAS